MKKLFAALAKGSLKALLSVFGKVADTNKGLIVPEELFRSIVAALGSGGTVLILIDLLQSVMTHAAVIFPNPLVAGLASTVLTLILDLLRRQNHDTTPALPIPPAPTIPAAMPSPE